jgi:hypothetical protein
VSAGAVVERQKTGELTNGGRVDVNSPETKNTANNLSSRSWYDFLGQKS